MSSDGKEFKTDITADPSAFVSGMNTAAKAAATASKDIDTQFKRIGETFSSVTKYLAGFTAVLAGGGALKKFISDANDWNSEAGKMSKQLGITTEQASVLNVALNHLGLDSSVVTDAAMKLSKNIQTNGQAFDVLGVKVRDTQGAYRPVTEVMGEVNAKLLAIHNPIEQNIAGMQVYGKGWTDIRATLKLTAGVMSDAETRAKQLNLVVGPEGVAMSKQYSMQMKDLNLVGKSLEVQFGNQLLPVFTRMGKFMSEEAPTMGKVFGTVLEGIGFAAAATWLALKDIGDGIGALAAQAAALLHGDIEGFKAIGKARDEEIARNEAAFVRMKNNFGKPIEAAKVEHQDDGPDPQYHFKEPKEKAEKADPGRVAEWEARLAQDKVGLERQGMLEGQYRQMSKADELKFWNELKARKDLSDNERVAISRKSSEIEMAGVKENFELKVAVLQAEGAAYKNNTDERMRIELEVQSKFQQGTKQYEESAKRIVEIQRQVAEQERAIKASRVQADRDFQLQTIALEDQAAQSEAQLGSITQAQLLNAQAGFENRRNAIAREALAERLQIALLDPDRNIVEIEKLNSEKEALERDHQLRMGQIRNQAALLATTNSRQLYDSMTSGFKSNLSQMIQGQTNFSGFMKATWNTVKSAVADVLAKMFIDYLANTTAMAAVKKALAISDIGTDAARAGAGAAASAASIPVAGWLLAAGAAAAAFALASGFSSSVPSFHAAGGFDIPGNVNPIVQAHEREMILPAKHADVIRNLADQGQGAGGGGGGDTHLHVHATDAQSVARLFRDNGHHIVNALQKQRRNLAF